MALTGHHEDEIEGLASRIALLVSDAGEAENAGRAFGALARKLGLSGGDLKEIFLSGVRATAGGRGGAPSELTRENAVLREHLEKAEIVLRQAERERAALRAENERYKTALVGRSRGTMAAGMIGAVLVCAAVAAGAWFLLGPRMWLEPAGRTAQAGTGQFDRTAVVRSHGAVLLMQPMDGAAVVAHVPPGTRLGVKRLVWNALLQWVEVDYGDSHGFVVTSDVDLS